MASTGKGSSDYYYGYGGKKKASKTAGHGKQPVIIGEDISFAASEAYKLLRTKIQFSFADGANQCRVTGLSSALSGEGKSVSAVNLAYTLSQLNKQVILIDCDMRRPTIAEKLRIQKKPGLSSYLTGQAYVMAEDQLSLFNEAEKCQDHKAEEPTEETFTVKVHTRKKKKTIDDMAKNLPEEEVLLKLPDSQLVCDKCGGTFKPIGKKFIRWEMLVIPRQVKILAYYTVTYACDRREKDTGFAHIAMVNAVSIPQTCAIQLRFSTANNILQIFSINLW